jgi:hypothetical protein
MVGRNANQRSITKCVLVCLKKIIVVCFYFRDKKNNFYHRNATRMALKFFKVQVLFFNS